MFANGTPKEADWAIEVAPVSTSIRIRMLTPLFSRPASTFDDVLRQRLADIDRDIAEQLAAHEVGTLLTTIDGIGRTTAARLIAELGDPYLCDNPEHRDNVGDSVTSRTDAFTREDRKKGIRKSPEWGLVSSHPCLT